MVNDPICNSGVSESVCLNFCQQLIFIQKLEISTSRLRNLCYSCTDQGDACYLTVWIDDLRCHAHISSFKHHPAAVGQTKRRIPVPIRRSIGNAKRATKTPITHAMIVPHVSVWIVDPVTDRTGPKVFMAPARPHEQITASAPAVVIPRHFQPIFPNRARHHDIVDLSASIMTHYIVCTPGSDHAFKYAANPNGIVIVECTGQRRDCHCHEEQS